MYISSNFSKYNYFKKHIFLTIIILSSIFFGQNPSILSSSFFKEKTERKELYQISSLARSTAVEIIIPLKSGSGVIIEKKGRQYKVLTACHLFEDIDLEIPIKIRTEDYKIYKLKSCIFMGKLS